MDVGAGDGDARLIGDVPIYDVIIGNEQDEVPLSKLERHLNKLPVNISVEKMDSLESKLTALSSRIGPAGLPKGPLPPQAKVKGVQRAHAGASSFDGVRASRRPGSSRLSC